MSASVAGLAPSDWATLLSLLDECSKDQLDVIRGILESEKEKQPMVENAQPSPAKSVKIAMELWDAMKAPEDPSAAELPEETLTRITMFAREVRNRTLDEISGAVDRAYTKFTETVVEDIRKRKE